MRIHNVIYFLNKYSNKNVNLNILPIISLVNVVILALFFNSINKDSITLILILVLIFSSIISYNIILLINKRKEIKVFEFFDNLKENFNINETNSYRYLNYILIDPRSDCFDRFISEVFSEFPLDLSKIYINKRYLFK